MNGVDLGRCKRIVQYLWDPEPRNDTEPDTSIWCLGREYPPSESTIINRDQPSKPNQSSTQSKLTDPEPPLSPNENKPRLHDVPADTDADTDNEPNRLHSWPEPFLNDFESRIWITYRSNFPPIPRYDSRDGAPSMTLSVRLRSQFMDSQGFTSDTGWGCMIRSGQSLLANTLSILVLGRGMLMSLSSIYLARPVLTDQIGDAGLTTTTRRVYFHSLLMHRMHRFQSIASSSTGRNHAINIPANGSGHRRLRDVYSHSLRNAKTPSYEST